MDYVQNSLIKDERILLAGRVHPVIYTFAYICILIVLFALCGAVYAMLTNRHPHSWLFFAMLALILSLFAFFSTHIYVKSTEFAVTTFRIVAKTGWLNQDAGEIGLDRIESLYVHQSPFGRMFGFGTVVASGTGVGRILMRFLRDPQGFRKAALEAMEQRKKPV